MLLNRPEGVRIQDGLGHSSFQPAAGGVAFPSTGVLDTFTDTNGTLLPDHDPEGGGVGTWIEAYSSGTHSIQTNQYANTGGDDDVAYFWNVSYGPRAEVFLTLSQIQQATSFYVVIGLRSTSNSSATADGYWTAVNQTNVIFCERFDNYVATTLDSASYTPTATDVIGHRSDGNTHTSYVDGVEVNSGSDSSFTSAGTLTILWGCSGDSGNNWIFDDFGGGTMP